MPAQNGRGWEAIDVRRESALHHLVQLSRWKNLFSSLLFCLPTELILKICVHTVEFDGLFRLALTAICHQLRETLISSPQFWNTVDFSSARFAKLFLERCKFDPHALFTGFRFRSVYRPREGSIMGGSGRPNVEQPSFPCVSGPKKEVRS